MFSMLSFFEDLIKSSAEFESLISQWASYVSKERSYN